LIKYIKRKYTNLISDTRFSEILTGSTWALAARVISTGLGLLISVIVARFYGAEMIGILAIINSFLMLATVFTLLGTGTSILRLIPEHMVRYSATSAFKVYRKAQYMVIGISIITGSIFFWGSDMLADKLFSKPQLSFYLAVSAVFIVFKSIMLLNTQAVRGLRLVRVFALMQVLPQIFTIMLIGLLAVGLSTKNVPVYAVLGGAPMTGILGWIIMEHRFKKQMQPVDCVRTMPAREMLSISFPMLMTNTMVFIIGETGVIMLGMFRNEADIGYYAIVIKLATLTSFIYTAINTIVASKVSELYHSGKMDDLFYVVKKSSKLIFWTTAPILFGLMVFGKPILSIFWGPDFAFAYPCLIVLLFGRFVHASSGANAIFMNMTGRQNIYRNIMILTAIANIGLNYFLVPRYGSMGAALANMLTLSGWNIATLIYIKVKFGKTTGYFPAVFGMK